MTVRRWLRSNGVALAALPVVAVVVFTAADDNGLRDMWRDNRRTITEHPVGAPATWKETTYRFVSADDVPADDADLTGPVPSGTRAVRIVVDATPPPSGDPPYCSAQLVDAGGRRFDPVPSDLPASFRVDDTCNPPPEDRASAFELRLMFLLPVDAVPHAIRLGAPASNDAVDLLVSVDN